MFHGAHDLVIRDSTFISTDKDVMWRLERHVSDRAAYNSYFRESAASCFPGTRTQYIDDITCWAKAIGQEPQHRLLWMNGPAGIGKTAIAQSCAEKVARLGVLGASFFFSKDNGVVDSSQFVTTIANQLRIKDKQYEAILEQKLRANPALPTQRTKDQLYGLIVEPFLELEKLDIHVHQRAIIIDGLDECNGDAKQSQIVDLVVQSVQAYGERVLLLWAFFSRPSQHLIEAFSSNSTSHICWQIKLSVSLDANSEIKHYLSGTLQKMQQSGTASSQWLSDDDLDKLVKIAAGLFIYAATIARFILDPDSLSPQRQLRTVLAFHSTQRLQIGDLHPMVELDTFYHVIMSGVPPSILSIVQCILLLHHELPRDFDSPRKYPHGRFWPFHTAYTTVPVRLLANLVELSLEELDRALSKLHSVLAIKQADEWDSQNIWGSSTIYFYHASFMEFLLDERRSKTFCILDQRHWHTLALTNVRLLNAMHKMDDIPRDQKVQALNELLSARPDSTCSTSRLLGFRNELYTYLHWNLLEWYGRAGLEPSGILVTEFNRTNFAKFRKLGVAQIEPDLLSRFPADISPRVKTISFSPGPKGDTQEVTLENYPTDIFSNIDQTWDYIRSGLDVLMSKTSVLAGHSRRTVARSASGLLKMKRAPGPEYMRSQLKDYFTSHIQELVKAKELEFRALSGLELLQHYVDEWKDYKDRIKEVHHLIFAALPLGSQEVHRDLILNITLVALALWEMGFLEVIQGNDLRLTEVVVSLLTQQRAGNLIDRGSPQAFLDCLTILDLSKHGIYQKHFTQAFIQATADFYAAEAAAFPTQCTLQSYLDHVKDRVEEEEAHIMPYLFAAEEVKRDFYTSLSSDTPHSRPRYEPPRGHLPLTKRVTTHFMENEPRQSHSIVPERYDIVLSTSSSTLLNKRRDWIYREFQKLLDNSDKEVQLQHLYSTLSRLEDWSPGQHLPGNSLWHRAPIKLGRRLHEVFREHVKKRLLAAATSYLDRNADDTHSLTTPLEIFRLSKEMGQKVFQKDFQSWVMYEMLFEIVQEHPNLKQVL
ncbi:hypothetical protein D9756_004282 [Leucocoprinus leucothites]|uniref:NACHT domain-containing protein n=1 Tax=Leucocoprinus leucothites TaxID=201217 RepID=A0A8H5G0W2_9AGAR|nr:hypothetical protein D9756_004282 [Leucoagaricus leucothites]